MKEANDLSSKMAELEKEIEWFYSEDFKLEDAVAKYKALIDLAEETKKDLDHLKNEIKVLTEKFDK